MPPSTDNAAVHLRVVAGRKSAGGLTFQNLIPNPVLGVLIFISGEVMLFAGLISAFVVLRANSVAWPPPDQPRLPIEVTGVNTLILLVSAYTMWRALRRDLSTADVRTWLSVSALLGTVFLAIQGSEWLELVSYGLRASTSTYASCFYALIGCHGLHVICGVTALLIHLRRLVRGESAAQIHDALLACGVFWFFVVGVWPILYVLVYLS